MTATPTPFVQTTGNPDLCVRVKQTTMVTVSLATAQVMLFISQNFKEDVIQLLIFARYAI